MIITCTTRSTKSCKRTSWSPKRQKRRREFPPLVQALTLIAAAYQLLDELEERQRGGGKVFVYHSCENFAERWFEIVFVLRCGTKALHERLEAR